MVSALVSRWSSPGSNPVWGHFVVFLGKAITLTVSLFSGFSSMKRLGVFLLPLDGMPVHRRVTAQH